MNLMIDGNLPIEVVRTNRRKTASIKIVEGQIQVVVPQSLSRKGIQEVIRKNTSWIRKKLLFQSQNPPVKPKEYVSGESFSYLGRNYRLKLTENDSGEVKLTGGQLVLGVNQYLLETERDPFVRSQLERWYINHAEQRLREKTVRYAKIIGVEPKSIKVKSYKSRWGSCSVRGEISYNWKIIIAPHHIVDYVIVHELSHIHHHNHSSDFWKCVERVVPDFKECREWLRLNGGRLVM